MLGYIKRQYRTECRLPLDLRTPIIHVPGISLGNFMSAEDMFVQSELISSRFRRFKFTKPMIHYGCMQYKKKKFNNLKIGSFVAVIFFSKTGLLAYNHSSKILRQASLNLGESGMVTAKYRGFVGHCIKKKNCKLSSYIILRTKLLQCIYTLKINIFAPNLIGFFIIPKLWKKKKKKKFRIFKITSKKSYSSSIVFKLKKLKKIKNLRLLKPKRKKKK